MRHLIIIISVLLCFQCSLMSSQAGVKGSKEDKKAFVLYNTKGERVTYDQLLKDLLKQDVLFIGELHNNPISHWLQLQLTKDIYRKKGEQLVLGAEMFEADDQLILDEYLEGFFSEKKLKNEAKLWPNYSTDYAPLLNFAKSNQLSFIATNVPRRYASVVYNHGIERLDSLNEEAYQYMTPLPVEVNMELESYKKMKEMGGQHGNPNLPYAQALKDATMAYFIEQNWSEGNYFIHYNGAYHSDLHEGIVWYLQQANADLNITTVTTVQQADIDQLKKENHGKADYIICVQEDMTKTH